MSILTRDNNGNVTGAFTPGTTQVLTPLTTSAMSTAFGSNTTHVMVSCAIGYANIAFGSSPTASLTTSMMIPPNSMTIFAVKPGDKMAVIKDLGVTVSIISVTELM